MGTLFRIVLYADSENKAQQASEAAFTRIDTLNNILTDYDPNSELSRLSSTAGTGTAVKLSPDLWYLLNKSIQISAKTEGAFDVTIGPMVQLWRRARRQHKLPASEAIAKSKNATGYKHVVLNSRNKTAILLQPGMLLDMGAIGKGYGVDEAMKVLKSHGIRSALVDGGGNIAVSKAPPGFKGWSIQVSAPHAADPDRNVSLLLTNRAVASSGDMYQYVDIEGKRYSHIVDPATGIGLTDQRRVTIIARNATDADWLSTALSILPPKEGLKVVRREPKAAAVILKKEGDIKYWTSERFHRYLKRGL